MKQIPVKRLYIFLLILYFAKSSVGFFKKFEGKEWECENQTLIKNLSVTFGDSNAFDYEKKFPASFRVKFSEFDVYFDIEFVKKIDVNQKKTKTNDIFVIDPLTGNPTEYNVNIPSEEFEHYVQLNGNGFATLIRNRHVHKRNPYRLIGTVYANNYPDIAFDILPIVIDSDKRTRRNVDHWNEKHYDSSSNHHGVFKRQIDIAQIYHRDHVDFGNDFIDNRAFLNEEIKFGVARDKLKWKQKNNQDDSTNNNRTKKSKPFHLNIELLVVTDLTVFNDHKRYANTNNTDVAFLHMKIYYSHLILGVNQRYANTLESDPDMRINIILSNFLFLTNKSDQNWLSSDNTTYNDKEVVISTTVLNNFRDFMNSKKIPFDFDIALALFNKDLWSDNPMAPPSVRTSVSGFAFIGTVCTSYNYAISEDFGAFSNLITIAHELGHNLGAYHDGELDKFGNCSNADNFIMTSSLNFQNSLNLLRFSNCSVNQFKSVLLTESRDDVSNLATCLINTSNNIARADLPQIGSILPGQIWSPNDQCQMIYGASSSFCQFTSKQICTLLYCRSNTSDSNLCNAKVGGAMEGTVCDSGKVCLKGVCTASSLAPVGDCIYGDEIITQGSISFKLKSAQMTCEQVFDLIEANNQSASGYCMDAYFKNLCCNSCKKFDILPCKDMFYDCPRFSLNCDNLFINGKLVRNLCPKTCGSCSKNELIQCSNSICLNGGKCRSDSNSDEIKCICPVGFGGKFCEIKNSCEPNPCQNGGICISLGSLYYVCQCAPNCHGYNCSFCSTTTKPNNQSKTTKFLNRLVPGEIKDDNDQTSTQIQQNTTQSSSVKRTCQNLDKKFCKYFKSLTNCKHDYFYLGISLKKYCCDLCL